MKTDPQAVARPRAELEAEVARLVMWLERIHATTTDEVARTAAGLALVGEPAPWTFDPERGPVPPGAPHGS